MATLVLICFFLSGLTGLIYEVLWTRSLVQVIGASPYAVGIILTVFMGGLGVGAYIAGRVIDRIRRPVNLVRLYGRLQLIIGIYALVVPLLLKAFTPLCSVLYNGLYTSSGLYHFLIFFGCGAILAIPVMCMGATLPILCRYYVSERAHLASRIGRLYGLNTLGAALGALLAGFWLIAWFGMTGTLILAVVLNIAIGIVCLKASTGVHTVMTCADVSEIAQATPVARSALRERTALVAVLLFAVSGFCGMAYEVIWASLLGLVVGPTTYSFTIVLVVFITGLGLGSMFFGRMADRTDKHMAILLVTQIAAAFFALAASQFMGNSQLFFAKLILTVQDRFAFMNISKALILFCLMFPTTFCLGAAFPLVGRICTRSLSGVGRSIGRVYAINTIGSVLGSSIASFILLPFVGKAMGLRIVSGVQFAAIIAAAVALVVSSSSSNHGVSGHVLRSLGEAGSSRLRRWRAAGILLPALAGLCSTLR